MAGLHVLGGEACSQLSPVWSPWGRTWPSTCAVGVLMKPRRPETASCRRWAPQLCCTACSRCLIQLVDSSWACQSLHSLRTQRHGQQGSELLYRAYPPAHLLCPPRCSHGRPVWCFCIRGAVFQALRHVSAAVGSLVMQHCMWQPKAIAVVHLLDAGMNQLTIGPSVGSNIQSAAWLECSFLGLSCFVCAACDMPPDGKGDAEQAPTTVA